MGSVVVKVEEVSKQYRLGKIGTGTFSHDLNRWWHTVRGKEDPYLKIGEVNDRTKKGNSEYVWALKDISLDVKQGDLVGIIGRNGAGKSTLLKILSRTTLPTTGSIKIKGRVASLLEVGTGFHPELTGRENIFLNAAILGMRKVEIAKKFDEIVDFAGVEKYLDTPVKRYSSGMYVRLAFGVAAHLEPEILVVDEVLAVGDIEFQKKALGKMESISKGQGRTVLFVSHNMGSIGRLCRKGIFLQNGQLHTAGEITEVIDAYVKSNRNIGLRKVDLKNKPGSVISMKQISIEANGKDEGDSFDVEDKIKARIYYEVYEDCAGTNIAFSLIKDGIILFRSWDTDDNPDLFIKRRKGSYQAEVNLPDFLNSGSYSISVASGKSNVGAFESHEECIVFDIENIKIDGAHNSISRGGLVKGNVNWSITSIS
jgi:lipopolysaccharide transport system ATP-binding protein